MKNDQKINPQKGSKNTGTRKNKTSGLNEISPVHKKPLHGEKIGGRKNLQKDNTDEREEEEINALDEASVDENYDPEREETDDEFDEHKIENL